MRPLREATLSKDRPAIEPGERRSSRRPRRHWQDWAPRTRIAFLALVFVLVAARLALPFAIESYVNRQLQKNKEYGGNIGDVNVSLYRGAYRIENISIFKREGNLREPFFTGRALDLSVEWKELFHGAVVGEVVMEQPQLNFVAGPTEAESQLGTNAPWATLLKSLFPFKLNRLEIDHGQVHFRNHHSRPPVDIALTELSSVATNLTNTRDLKNPLPAGIRAHSKAFESGTVDLDVKLDPLAGLPTFEMSCQLSNVNLVALNPFLMAYGKFDVNHGRFALYTSVASKEGAYEGYVKTFFDDLDVFEWQKEKKKNPFLIAWEAIVGTLAAAFKNHDRDSLATRVPISGTYNKSEVGTWTAIGNLLRNAFVQALLPRLDEHVTVGQVEKKVGEKKESPPPKTTPRDGEKGAQRLIDRPQTSVPKTNTSPPAQPASRDQEKGAQKLVK
ncbi:MAG TPA: DUF748 domain-containing protein [Verrucomicrobiae bacterium]|nr:DUF748 domain-containing protein [Verrucomicrobiae bacterium]